MIPCNNATFAHIRNKLLTRTRQSELTHAEPKCMRKHLTHASVYINMCPKSVVIEVFQSVNSVG